MQVGIITAATARDQNLCSRPIIALQHQRMPAVHARLDGTHEAACTTPYDDSIVIRMYVMRQKSAGLVSVVRQVQCPPFGPASLSQFDHADHVTRLLRLH